MSRGAPAWVALVAFIAATPAAASRPARATGPEVAPGARFAAGRALIAVNAGFGLPTGMIGGSIVIDLDRIVYVEGGAGLTIGGAEVGLGVGLRQILEPGVAIDASLHYSVDQHYERFEGIDADPDAPFRAPGHWLNALGGIEMRT